MTCHKLQVVGTSGSRSTFLSLSVELSEIFFEISFIQEVGSTDPPYDFRRVEKPNLSRNYAILDKATQASVLSQWSKRKTELAGMVRTEDSNMIEYKWVIKSTVWRVQIGCSMIASCLRAFITIWRSYLQLFVDSWALSHDLLAQGSRSGLSTGNIIGWRQCTLCSDLPLVQVGKIGHINGTCTQVIDYLDFLSDGANVLAVRQDEWHMSFKFTVLVYPVYVTQYDLFVT